MQLELKPDLTDVLIHVGMPRRSGRYPWGSGEDPYQHGSQDFLGRIEELRKSGWAETPENIKEEFGLTTTQYRIEKSLAKSERRMLDVARAKSLSDDGLTLTQIGEKMGKNESSIRSLLNEKAEIRMQQAMNTANFLKKTVDEKGMIDVGVGTEKELGISREKMKEALYILEREGYYTFKGGISQVTNPGKQSNQIVLCPPDTPYKINAKGERVSSAIYDFERVHSLKEYTSHDGGETFDKLVYPKSMDSKRMMVRYKEDGGEGKDGIVEIRRGVDDLSLGDAKYSQVRILVDDTKYIKGMAVYSDDMPDGVDIIFNTNKSKSVPKLEVLKDIKNDPDNPFGSLIKANGQSYYVDKDGNKQLSLINKRADQGDWSEWSNALPSQFLSKQSRPLAKKQLDLAKKDKLAEFDEICSINNPTIKKHLLQDFANNCDAAAVNLKAAALPGQKYHVIVPDNTLKDTEVYAPNYENGTKLALIRYPHGGTFEIPILTVNNRHKSSRELIGTDSQDAICITKKNADRLSGADFDGDTVMCIPTNDSMGKVKIASRDNLEGLEGFDSKSYQYTRKEVDADGTEHYYRGDREFRVMKNTGTQMGVISNLITDMTLAGADEKELARAVRHSMVVIDAEKHKLDYRQSELDNDIAGLKKIYQRTINPDGTEGRPGGASTIISRAKGEQDVLKRQGSPKVNMKDKPWYDPSKPEGALLYKTADDVSYEKKVYNKRTGETKIVTEYKTQPSTQMAETDDAHTLVSKGRHPMELLYADYANSMKALANQARKEMMTTPRLKYDPEAKKKYASEVASLDTKLNNALMNSPREREAQRRANVIIKEKQKKYKEEHGEKMKKSDVKKASQQAINKTRKEVDAVKRRERNIDITDEEWEAIQKGAISEDKLTKILNNTDVDKLRERATPKIINTPSAAKISKIKAMSASNYSLAEIAKSTGLSTTTVSKYLKGA